VSIVARPVAVCLVGGFILVPVVHELHHIVDWVRFVLGGVDSKSEIKGVPSFSEPVAGIDVFDSDLAKEVWNHILVLTKDNLPHARIIVNLCSPVGQRHFLCSICV
jgi:hypothetical protein